MRPPVEHVFGEDLHFPLVLALRAGHYNSDKFYQLVPSHGFRALPAQIHTSLLENYVCNEGHRSKRLKEVCREFLTARRYLSYSSHLHECG